jgi:predicted ATPase
MHIEKMVLHPERYPVQDLYPFNLTAFQKTARIDFPANITFFAGENGTGKSTLLRAITRRCGVHIWEDIQKRRVDRNPYLGALYKYIEVSWKDGVKPGAFFSAENFQYHTQCIDDWAAADLRLLDYFGGKSLLSQSHGQAILGYARARYLREGIYFLDEPETALSPRTQIAFLALLREMAHQGHAQFIVASHSPILLSCPEAVIYSFDGDRIAPITYEETDYYRVYKAFLEDREKFL